MNNTKRSTLTAVLLAILPPLALIPLGFTTLGPLNSIIMYIPIIIGSVALGSEIGSTLDGMSGIISLVKNMATPTFLPSVLSPFIPMTSTDHGSWKAPLIVLTPRILIGVVSYLTYKWLNKLAKEEAQPVSLFMAGTLGSATSTILVMNIVYSLFNSARAETTGRAGTIAYLAVIATIFSSDVSEAFVIGTTTSAIASVLPRLTKRNTT